MSLPLELSQKWGTFPNIRKHTRGEWTSSRCPRCGDSGKRDGDRWVMFESTSDSNAHGWCRKCEYFEWADDNPEPPTIGELWERQVKEEKRREQWERSVERRLRLLEEEVQRFHANAKEAQELWLRDGITPYHINRYRLGVVRDHHRYAPSLVIPYWNNSRLDWLQYRLLEPDGAGKYRGPARMPTKLFRTEPKEHIKGKDVLVVEGAKKAMVTWLAYGDKYLVTGLPSKNPSSEVLSSLSEARSVYLGLDPDAHEQDASGLCEADRVISRLRHVYEGDILVISYPEKPDELMYRYNADTRTMLGFAARARRVTA